MNADSDDRLVQRFRLAALIAGVVTALLGIIVLFGWVAEIGTLKTVLAGLASMKANAALCFVLAGVSLILLSVPQLPHASVGARLCAALVLLVATLTLIEYAFGLDLRIDELLFSDLNTPHALHPGRMAPATAVAFLLASLALMLAPRHSARLVQVLAFIVAAIGVTGLVGYMLHFELLYTWYAFSSVALHTALGLTLLGFGLAAAMRTAQPDSALSDEQRITRLAAWLLALAAGLTGIAGVAVVEAEVHRILREGLTLALQARVEQINTSVALRMMLAQTISTRPNMLRHLRLLAGDPHSAESRGVVQGVLESFRTHGFSGIAIMLPGGEEVARVGLFVNSPALAVRLDTDVETTLLWQSGMYLRHRMPLQDAQGPLGTVVAEQFLPSLTEALVQQAAASKSMEFLLCRPEASTVSCFPTGLTAGTLSLPRQPQRLPTLVHLALAQSTGFGVSYDLHGRRAIGAYSPVGALGLVAVLKLDAWELYRPIGRSFQVALVLIALLTVGGTLLVRARVRPLAVALEKRVQERTAALAGAYTDLERSETRFRRSIQNAPYGVLLVNIEGSITFINAEAERILGYRSEELLGQAVEVVVPETVRPQHPRLRADYLRDPVARRLGKGRDLYAQRKDGALVPVEISLAAVDGPEQFEVLASVVDISERKQALQALRESEERYRTLVENAPEAILVLDVEAGRFVMASESALRLFGYNREIILQLGPADVAPAVQPDGRPSAELAREVIAQSLAGHTVVFEYLCRKADGTEMLCEARIIRLPGADRTLIRGTVYDISERKKAQQGLEAALAEKTVLLNEIHHRVKNNLQIVASLLQLQGQQARNPELERLLEEAQNRVKSMVLIHQILYERKDFSAVPLDKYLDHLTRLLTATYRLETERIAVRLALEEMAVDLNRAVPCGLLVNELVTNSFKHAFPDGRKGEVCISLEKTAEGDALVTVSDTGVGLPPGFDPRRAKTLGLQLAHLLAEQAGGTLSARGGPGTRFELRFPRG